MYMKNQQSQNGIIEAPLKVSRIRTIYNIASNYYFLATLIEKKPLMRGIELAEIKQNDKVLEVAVGLGFNFLEFLKRVNSENIVHGIDLSPKMLDKTKKLITKKGFSNFKLSESDARQLPFPNDTFDILFNSYMLDLTPLNDFPVVLNEFYRVLKKGGRLITVNFSKKDCSPVFSEKLYKLTPSLWHGCRPVLMESFIKQAGFKNIQREFHNGIFTLPSEIVISVK
ncbi:MAG: methyltransferase domain-containing protein [Porphyromonadaceae bacterium]|nr:MAG: methyltransferase domain-containing protein [Porphyromonadaceae bacterium]